MTAPGLARPTVGVSLSATTARGIRLGASALRPAAVRRAGAGRVAEVPFDPARPELAVAALRERLGDAGRVALAIGWAHLHVAAVRLPPVSPPRRAAILALEPDRFFPLAGPAAVAVAGEGGAGGAGADGVTAFAADGADVERWVAAFSAWAPVVAVHAAPVAVAREAAAEGTFVVPGEGEDERAILTLRGGALVGARRTSPAPSGARDALPELPGRDGVEARFLAALGAARAADAAPHDQLLTPALARRVRADQRRRLATAALACAAALVFAVWCVDRARARVLSRTEAAVAAAADSAAPALAVVGRLAALDRAWAAAAGPSGASAADPLAVIAALGGRLPADVTVLALSVADGEWQLDGRAANAAAVVPALDGDARFDEVRLVGPTTRFTEAGRAYESFSLAFRVRP